MRSALCGPSKVIVQVAVEMKYERVPVHVGVLQRVVTLALSPAATSTVGAPKHLVGWL